MTKDQLQQELLNKLQPGIKPSDLKKSFKKPSKTPQSPPPMSINEDERSLSDFDKSDEGYESDNSLISNGQSQKPDKKPEQNAVKNEPNPAIKTLQKEITSLKRQLQAYKDFKDADLKIKEQLKQENQTLKKTIQDLKNQAKNTEENPQPEKIKTPKPQPKLYLFTCSICDQNKKSQLHLAKVNGLGINPTKLQKICDYCIKRVDIIKEREEEFF